jgi:uncharacterized protein (TIGR02217 family)
MAFHEIQFPTDISYGSQGGPEFSTEVVVLSSGHEQRNINWSAPLHRYDVAYGIKRWTQLRTLHKFFYNRKGKAHGFRYKDWFDYQGTTENLGTGDALETDFQLRKAYSDGSYTYYRTITKAVSGSVAIFIDGVSQGAGWSVNINTGIVAFGVAPGAGEVVTATFEFDVPCRFDVDHIPVNLEEFQKGNAPQIKVVELKSGGV